MCVCVCVCVCLNVVVFVNTPVVDRWGAADFNGNVDVFEFRYIDLQCWFFDVYSAFFFFLFFPTNF